MARNIDDAGYVSDVVSEAEIELFETATSGDWFIKDGLREYGADWQSHIPRLPSGLAPINLAAQYLFGWQFQEFQLGTYYCPLPDRMVIGARGCGKTTAVAVANALRAIFHPGHNWLHVAPSIEQARAMFDIILNMGRQEAFYDLFIRHIRSAPAPDIFIKPWNEADPATQFNFRSIGGHGGQPMELLRSLEAGIISADEAFRTFKTDYYVPILVGMSRGPNQYTLNAHPELREVYSDYVHRIQVQTDPVRRVALQEELDNWVDRNGVSKDRVLTLSGNAGVWPIWWQRFKWGEQNPQKRWSQRWISEQNLYFTASQRAFLAQQFEGDPEGLRVEMYAERPIISGGVFSALHTDNMADEDIAMNAADQHEAGIPGWSFVKHQEHGLIDYTEPAEPSMAYAAGTDPGTGKIPNRNSWVIIWCRLDGPPFRIVGLKCGNFKWSAQGTLDPWIAAMKTMIQSYHFPMGHVATEATGPQKGVAEVVYRDNLEVYPLNMSTQKATLIMQAQLMLSRSMFVGPHIELLVNQLIAYEHADRKLNQDFVMAFLSLVAVVWPYVEEEFRPPETDHDWIEQYQQNLGREIRDGSRYHGRVAR